MADGFGRLAWVYEGLERLVYGDLLWQARLALLGELGGAERVLILGEGDGRFLLALLNHHETCNVTVLERSPGMVRRTQTRLETQLPEAQPRVTLWQRDALQMALPTHSYDVIVANFFLDVFAEAQLPTLVEKLNACLEPGGVWLISDFAPPQDVKAGRRRRESSLLLPLMYGFFRLLTQLPATRLVPPQPYLEACGLELKRAEHFRGGFVYAQLWQKPEAAHA